VQGDAGTPQGPDSDTIGTQLPIQSVIQAPAQPVQSELLTKTDDEIEDLIVALLDLIAPQGFTAKHLPIISAWQETTRVLIRTIGS
jgi:hypothetical protein